MYRYGFQATIFLQLLGKKKKTRHFWTWDVDSGQISFAMWEPADTSGSKQSQRIPRFIASHVRPFGVKRFCSSWQNAHGNWFPPPRATTVSTACAVENTHKRWATLCLMKFAVCLPIPYFVNTLTVCSASNLWNAEGWKAKRDGASLTCNVESFRVWRAWLLLLIGEHVVATSIVTCEELSCRYAAFTHNSQQVWFSYQPQGEQVSGSHRWRCFSPRRALGRRRPCCVGRARPCSGLCL